MKYPLRLVHTPNSPNGLFAVADASNKIVCHVLDDEWDAEFAEFIVKAANRRRWWRRWFVERTRDDWMWQRNTTPSR